MVERILLAGPSADDGKALLERYGEAYVLRGRSVWEKIERQHCCHHWMLADPAGSASDGICKLCGAHKKFMNCLSDCLQVGEEEYEAWLRRQRGYIKGGELED